MTPITSANSKTRPMKSAFPDTSISILTRFYDMSKIVNALKKTLQPLCPERRGSQLPEERARCKAGRRGSERGCFASLPTFRNKHFKTKDAPRPFYGGKALKKNHPTLDA
jgi:hypothetical protein